jgi:hypothetical protein
MRQVLPQLQRLLDDQSAIRRHRHGPHGDPGPERLAAALITGFAEIPDSFPTGGFLAVVCVLRVVCAGQDSRFTSSVERVGACSSGGFLGLCRAVAFLVDA